MRYERSSNYACGSCPDSATNALKIVGFFLLMLIGILILIGMNI